MEKLKYQLDKNGIAGALLMDLCKDFDTIDYDLLIKNLHAYGLGKKCFSFSL